MRNAFELELKQKKCKPLELQFEISPVLRQTKQIAHCSKLTRGKIQTRELCRICEVSDLHICSGGKKYISTFGQNYKT